jgi:hypothetical protein
MPLSTRLSGAEERFDTRNLHVKKILALLYGTLSFPAAAGFSAWRQNIYSDISHKENRFAAFLHGALYEFQLLTAESHYEKLSESVSGYPRCNRLTLAFSCRSFAVLCLGQFPSMFCSFVATALAARSTGVRFHYEGKTHAVRKSFK